MALLKKKLVVWPVALAGFLLLCGAPRVIGQAPAASSAAPAAVKAKDFAGTWNWMFKDKRFATMTLDLEGNRLAGTVTNEWMNMDERGRITGAEPRPGSSVITKALIENGKLSIVEKTGEEELEWSMTLTSATTAELRILGAGAPANAEPVRLEKVWSEPPVEK
jgi:hypothetical protein